MKKILFIGILLFFIFPVYAQNSKIKWNPVCRHNALYWAITVKEQYPTRIKYGYFMDSRNGKILSYHVQPQVKIGENWYYFKVENNSVFIIFNMNEWTIDDKIDVWVPRETFYDFSEYVKQLEEWGEK
jgi:hypothetical protein